MMATEGAVRGRRCSASSRGFLLPECGGQQFLAPAQGEGRDVNRMSPLNHMSESSLVALACLQKQQKERNLRVAQRGPS